MLLLSLLVFAESVGLRRLLRETSALTARREGESKTAADRAAWLGHAMVPFQLARLDASGYVRGHVMQGRPYALLFLRAADLALMDTAMLVAQIRGIGARARGRVGLVCVGDAAPCDFESKRLAAALATSDIAFLAHDDSSQLARAVGLVRMPGAIVVNRDGVIAHIGYLTHYETGATTRTRPTSATHEAGAVP